MYAHTCMHTHIHTSAHASHTYVPITQTLACKRANLSPPPSPVGPAGHRGTCSASPMCQDTGGGSCPTGAQLWLGKYNTCSKTQGSGGINSALPSSSLSGHHLLSLPGATRVETYPL